MMAHTSRTLEAIRRSGCGNSWFGVDNAILHPLNVTIHIRLDFDD